MKRDTILEFAGDLSAARRAQWVNASGRDTVSVGIGWPAGVVGTIGVELSNHGQAGVAGAAYSITMTQPAGTAGGALITGIEPNGASSITVVWTPGVGNDGVGKHFTDESGVAGTEPLLCQP
jgi:hypothetical protein